MTTLLDRTEPRPPQQPRTTWVFRGVVFLLFLILVAQLWRLQIVDGRGYVRRSADNNLRRQVIPPQRGVIYDRNRTLLASNAPTFVVSLTLADVPRDRLPNIVDQIAGELRVPAADLNRIIETRRARKDFSTFTAIPLRYGVDRDAIMRLAERGVDLPGVRIDVESRRHYADGLLTSHLIGYMGPISPDEAARLADQGYTVDDRIGAAGIEQWYETDLRGLPGRRLYQVEVSGQEVGELRRENPIAGNNLVLSLDLQLQRDVMRILQEGLKASPEGAAIVMDPRNGEVLAMVSSPSFDNNAIGDPAREDEVEALLKAEKEQPMFPRAFAGQYAPGSVFKLVTGSAALQENIATRDTIIESRGEMWVESEEYPELRTRLPDNAAWGPQNFLQGLANSSNIYFFWLGGGYQEGGRVIFEGLDIDRLASYAQAFGFGRATGLDVPGETGGIVPNQAWKQLRRSERWYKGDTYNMSIGQGFVLATPLQVANMTNAIANGGYQHQPHLAAMELDSEGRVIKVFRPEPRRLPIEERHLALMREAMEFAFDGPHLKQFKIPELRVAGKTGTAEFAGGSGARENPTHGWFTAFAPADNPVVSVTVFVSRGSGSSDASPIGVRILRRIFGLPDATTTPPTPGAVPGPAPAA